MRESILGLPEQMRTGLTLKADPPMDPFPIRSVLLVGMGGSAIGADMVLEWLRDRLEVPAAVARGGVVPAWVGRDTAVVAISYSGNTRETLEAAESAARAAGGMVAITTGGKLSQFRGGDLPRVTVPPGMPPRTALGYLFSATARLFEDLGLASSSEEVAEAAEELEGNMPNLGRTAVELAERLEDTMPTVYGYHPYVSVARRWSTQLNENAKMVAWWGELPEASHNQVEGWGQEDGESALSAVFLREPDEEDRSARLVDEVVRVFSRQAECHEVVMMGGSVLSRMFSGVVVGDLVSVELAAKRGVNPIEVPLIEALKRAVEGK
jgi:glucose/mannose-6-phosphate isomerase